MGSPLVSVLLPVRDAEEHVGVALRSMRRQTLSDIEIVCVDDGSRDHTLRILRDHAAADPRVRVRSTERLGLVPALQSAHGMARAPLLARMDADDASAPTRLERELALLEGDPGLAVASCLVRAFPARSVRRGMHDYLGWSNGVVTSDEIATQILVECPVVHPTVLMRREPFEGVGGYREGAFPEDYDLWLRLHRAGARFEKVPGILHAWRERPGRLTRVDPRYDHGRFLDLKADHLAHLLRGTDREVVVVGAGVAGKPLALRLAARGHPVRAFVELNPRKVGMRIHGAPVLPRERIHELRGALFLAAVSARGQREVVRADLVRRGLAEGEDFLCVV